MDEIIIIKEISDIEIERKIFTSNDLVEDIIDWIMEDAEYKNGYEIRTGITIKIPNKG